MKRIIFLCFFIFACSSEKPDEKKNIKVDYILRDDNTLFCPLYKPKFQKRKPYPWEEFYNVDAKR